MFTASGIEKNRMLEGVKAQISSVATNLTRLLEEDNEDTFDHNADTLSNSIGELCSDFGCHLSLCYEHIYRTYYRQTVLPSLKNMNGIDLVEGLHRRMIKHTFMVSSLSEIFRDLNNFVAQIFATSEGMPKSLPLQVLYKRQRRGTKIRNLEDLAILAFRDELLLKINFMSRAGVMDMIRDEREGVEIDRDLLKNVLHIYMQSGIGKEIYKEHIEIFFLHETASYYSCKASSWILEYSCAEYMTKYEELLEKEKEIVTYYLDSSTEPKLDEVMHTELLVSVAKQILEKAPSFHALLRDDKVDDLSRMYRLYLAIPEVLESVAGVFRLHIATEGDALIKQAAEDAATSGSVEEQDLVSKIIELHDKYMAYVTVCFQEHTLFHKALIEAFEIFCSKKVAEIPSAELLATFLYNLFKKAESAKSNLDYSTLESTIDNVVKLIAYINDKDLFAKFCSKKLAHWLLVDQSRCDMYELLLSSLKLQFGAQYTSSMMKMVTDMPLAKEIQSNFMGSIERRKIAKLGVDFSATVLTSCSWPSNEKSANKSSKVKLPLEMVKCIEAFGSFYERTTKHRKLRWDYSLGKCIVTGRFDAGLLDFVVSTYQAAVLCVFNEAERLTYKDIIEQVDLTDEDLLSVLHSLSGGDYKILNKEPASITISKTDSFEFNSKFNDKRRRITVPLSPLHERKEVVEEVGKDRSCAIEACLVKIMKEKQVLPFQQLIAECVKGLSGVCKPEIKKIKERIESLMGREYLIRDTEDANSYRYLP